MHAAVISDADRFDRVPQGPVEPPEPGLVGEAEGESGPRGETAESLTWKIFEARKDQSYPQWMIECVGLPIA